MQQAHTSSPRDTPQPRREGQTIRPPSSWSDLGADGLNTTFFMGDAESRVVWPMAPTLRDMHSSELWPHVTQNTFLAELVKLGAQWSLQTKESLGSFEFSKHLHLMLDRLLCSNQFLARVLPAIETTTRDLQTSRKSDLRAQVHLEAVAIRSKILGSLSQDPSGLFDETSQDLPITHWSDIFFRRLWNDSHIRGVLVSATGSAEELHKWFQGAIREYCNQPGVQKIMSASEAEQFLKVTTNAAAEAGLFNEQKSTKASVLELARCPAFSSYVRQEIHDVLAQLFVRARTELLTLREDLPENPSQETTRIEEQATQDDSSILNTQGKKTLTDFARETWARIKSLFLGSSPETRPPPEDPQQSQAHGLPSISEGRKQFEYDNSEWRIEELLLQQEPSTPLMRRLRAEALASVELFADQLFASKDFRDQLQEAVLPVLSARYQSVVQEARDIAQDHIGPYISSYSKAQLAADLQRGLLSQESRSYLNDRVALSWYGYEHIRQMHWQRYPENFISPLNVLFRSSATTKLEDVSKVYSQIEELVLEIPYRRQERSLYLSRLAELFPPESVRRAEFEREARVSSKVREWVHARLYPEGKESFVRRQISNRVMPYLMASEDERMAAVKNTIESMCGQKVTEACVRSRFWGDSVDAAKQRISSEITEAFVSQSALTVRTLDYLEHLLGVVIEEELIKQSLALVQKYGGHSIPQGETSQLARQVFDDIFSNHVLADLDLLQGFLVLTLDQQAQSFAEQFFAESYPDPLEIYLSLSPDEQREEFLKRLEREGLLKDTSPPPLARTQPVQKQHSWLRHLPGFSHISSWISSTSRPSVSRS